MNQESILKNCSLIQKAIDLQIPAGDIDSTEGKLMELISMMGLSAEVMKEARFHVLHKQGLLIDIIRREERGISATNLKLLLESRMASELTVYEYSERLNAAISHAIDGLRSVMSKWKLERQIAQYEPK